MSRISDLVVTILVLALVQTCSGHARTFTRCQLSRELLRYNFPRSLIPNWVCLIEHASGRTTDKVTNHNNSYTSYGLFQIHNKDWCKKGRKGGHCNMKCEELTIELGTHLDLTSFVVEVSYQIIDLINEDLADDVRCAKRIYDRVGFKAWPSSYSYCKEKAMPDLSRC